MREQRRKGKHAVINNRECMRFGWISPMASDWIAYDKPLMGEASSHAHEYFNGPQIGLKIKFTDFKIVHKRACKLKQESNILWNIAASSIINPKNIY